MSSILEEVLGVEGDNTSLIRLSYISKNCVNHANLNVDNKNYNFVQYFIFFGSYQHAVFMWVTSIFNDGNDICALFGNINQVPT